LLLGDEELFIPFEKFTWFRDATIGAISNVEWPSTQHLYWPALDSDVESIRYPERFPLLARLAT
jgi:hypothetical protein